MPADNRRTEPAKVTDAQVDLKRYAARRWIDANIGVHVDNAITDAEVDALATALAREFADGVNAERRAIPALLAEAEERGRREERERLGREALKGFVKDLPRGTLTDDERAQFAPVLVRDEAIAMLDRLSDEVAEAAHDIPSCAGRERVCAVVDEVDQWLMEHGHEPGSARLRAIRARRRRGNAPPDEDECGSCGVPDGHGHDPDCTIRVARSAEAQADDDFIWDACEVHGRFKLGPKMGGRFRAACPACEGPRSNEASPVRACRTCKAGRIGTTKGCPECDAYFDPRSDNDPTEPALLLMEAHELLREHEVEETVGAVRALQAAFQYGASFPRRERAITSNLHGCTAPVRCGECAACREAEGR